VRARALRSRLILHPPNQPMFSGHGGGDGLIENRAAIGNVGDLGEVIKG